VYPALSMARSSLLFATAALLAALVPGCAEEREPINRVQPDALKKSFFVGDLASPDDDPEFYHRATVVAAPTGAGNDGLFTASDSGPTSRVRFEIRQDMLLARLTYELINDTDRRGARRTPDGQVVAAYRISKHFDIRRAYSDGTGEEQNVVVENDSDRPWYEREFMRVDWSKNLIETAYDLDTLAQIGVYGGVTWENMAYFVNDPGHPDAPVFDDKTGYFDLTAHVFATPQLLEDEWGKFPACWLVGSFPLESCNPSEISLRLSFKRVQDTDYEPLAYDGNQMDMFGYFTVDRYGYDRGYGVVDDRWHRFATRWNLFEKSHSATACAAATPAGQSPHRDDNKNGTEDECEAVGRGSRCDEFRGLCTVPLRDRKVKTIPWYVNRESPADLFDGTREALERWSNALRQALVAGRLAECRRAGETGCEAQMKWPGRWSGGHVPPVGSASPAEVPAVFVLCHNPVDTTKDDPACGDHGTSPRLGDLRYNIIDNVVEPQRTSPWGIMMDAEDPLTGEKISGSVHQWVGTLDRAAASTADILLLLDGQIDPAAYISGQDISAWVNASKSDKGEKAAMSKEELAQRKGAFDPKTLSPLLKGTPQKKKGHPLARRHERAQALATSLGPGNASVGARMSALRGTATEARLISPEMAQAAGADPRGPLSPQLIDRATPLGRMNPAVRRTRARDAAVNRAKRHSCRMDDAEPDYLLGMARRARDLFPLVDPADPQAVTERRKKVVEWARQTFSKGVLSHELGHSMGLRHNFAASFDSLNYRPEYWQLRTRNGTLTDDCPEGNDDGSTCVGPRWRDPLTDEEIEGNIGAYATTSVMDYPGDANHDQLTNGKYDDAAVRFGYGGVVDVWQGPGVSVNEGSEGQAEAYRLLTFTQGLGLDGVRYFSKPDGSVEFIHYSQFQKNFSLLENCADSADPGAVLGQRCDERAIDVVDFRDMADFATDPAYAQFSWALAPRAVDPQGRVRRGYLFSSDEFSDAGNVPVFTYDAGADPYEQVRFLEKGYENRYVFDSFRRNRTLFNSYDATSRVQAHYLDAIHGISKSFAFGAVLSGDPLNPTEEFLADGNYGPLALAGSVAFDLHARTLTRPDPGYYWCPFVGDCPSDVAFVADPLALPDTEPHDFHIPLGPGRFIHNDYDYSKGYFWSDYQTQVGSYYDKIWASYYLTEAFDDFISNSREDFTDGRYKNVNFATVYPEQTRRLFASLFTGDINTYAPWVVGTKLTTNPADATIVYPDFHALTPPATAPKNSKRVDPGFGWNEQLYAMTWGAIFFPTSWSNQWINDTRIALLPAENVPYPASESLSFFDPVTGLTYRAHRAGREVIQGVDVEKSPGARMLEWGNQLVINAYDVQTDKDDLVLFNDDGTPKLKLDADGLPVVLDDYYAAQLRKYVANIDMMRELTATFDRALTDMPL